MTTGRSVGEPGGVGGPDPGFDGLDAADVRDFESLVDRFAPELAPRLGIEERFGPYVGSIIFTLVVLSLLAQMAGVVLVDAAAAVTLGASFLGGTALGEGVARVMHAQEQRRHRTWLAERPWEVQERLVSLFRSRVEARRHDLLGPQSSWATTRRPLEEAMQEAERSLRYWEEREGQAPDDPNVVAHRAMAGELAEKLGRALASLDRRSDALRAFLDRCDAKLAVLEQGRRDAEESRKLTGIARQADEVVERADAALGSIAARFVRDARDMADALSGLERVRLLESAAEVPVDGIEAVADRILDEERRTDSELEDLRRSVAGFADDA
ncbi:MAG: hypothetical protein RH859_12065 [Longimicrobiales bacterium]